VLWGLQLNVQYYLTVCFVLLMHVVALGVLYTFVTMLFAVSR